MERREIELADASLQSLVEAGDPKRPDKLSDDDVAALILAATTPEELAGLLDDAVTADVDGPVRRALAHYLWVAIRDGREMNNSLEDGDIVGTAWLEATKILFSFAANDDRECSDATVECFKKYIKGALKNVLHDLLVDEWLDAKMGTHDGEPYVMRPRRGGEGGQFQFPLDDDDNIDESSFDEVLTRQAVAWEHAVEIADEFYTFYSRLSAEDQEILLGTVDDPAFLIRELPFAGFDAVKTFQKQIRADDVERAERYGVDVSTIRARRKHLGCAFTKFQRGKDVFTDYRPASWFDRTSVVAGDVHRIGASHDRPRRRTIVNVDGAKIRGYRPAQKNYRWGCPTNRNDRLGDAA